MDEHVAPLVDMSGESLVDLLHRGPDERLARSIQRLLADLHDPRDQSISAWSSHIE